MDRVLMLRCSAVACAVELRLNDIVVARLGSAGGVLCLPVHEYVLAGENRLTATINPTAAGSLDGRPTPMLAPTDCALSVRLLLPRVAQIGSESHARTLAELDWAVPEGEVFRAPLVISTDAILPIKFPRWRWLDAPVIEDLDLVKPLVSAYLQGIAVALAQGDVEVFVAASRMRLEELAQAYQRPLIDVTERLRSRLKLLHATHALRMVIPSEQELNLIPCAGQRMLECTVQGGEPALRTQVGERGAYSAWPVRVAVVEGSCHVLR